MVYTLNCKSKVKVYVSSSFTSIPWSDLSSCSKCLSRTVSRVLERLPYTSSLDDSLPLSCGLADTAVWLCVLTLSIGFSGMKSRFLSLLPAVRLVCVFTCFTGVERVPGGWNSPVAVLCSLLAVVWVGGGRAEGGWELVSLPWRCGRCRSCVEGMG